MPQGLKNSPAFFKQIMGYILDDLKEEHKSSVIVYYDDLFCFSSSISNHLDLLQDLFSVLEKHGIKLSLSKAQFCPKDSIQFLGFTIDLSDERLCLIIMPLANLYGYILDR